MRGLCLRRGRRGAADVPGAGRRHPRAGAYVLGEDGGFTLAAHRGLSEDFVAACSHFAADSPNAPAFREGVPLYTRYADFCAQGDHCSETARGEGLDALAIVPVFHEAALFGFFMCASRTMGAVPAPSRTALESVAAQVGGAVARIHAEGKRRASEERYRLLIERMNDGVGVQDAEGILTFANTRFSEMLGYERQERVGRPAADFLDPPSRERLEKHMAQRRAGGRAPYELVFQRKDHSALAARISPEPLFGNGVYEGSFAVISDISGRELFRELARRDPGLKAVLVTGYGGEAQEQAAIQDGMLGLIRKPFRIAELARATARAIEGEKT